MKIIFITDTHAMASNPRARLDNFQETILNKMRYIGEYIKENDIDLLIHGGDWLHTPDVSEGMIREFSKIIMSYPCKVVGVLGNHDIYGFNPDTFNRTTFGVAEGLGVFDRLGNKPLIIGDVAITGVDSCHELDKPGNERLYSESERVHDKINIHVVHGMLVKQDWDMVAHTKIDNISSSCNADIILTGHEHNGYGIVVKDNVTFSNPGSLARITAGTGDVRKDVRFTQIETKHIDTKMPKYDIMLVNLPIEIARSSSDVIDSYALELEKKNKADINDFISRLGNMPNEYGMGYKAALDSLCLDEEIYDECMKHIEAAQEEIGK